MEDTNLRRIINVELVFVDSSVNYIDSERVHTNLIILNLTPVQISSSKGSHFEKLIG